MIPALLIRMSTLVTFSANSRTDDRSCRSSGRTSTSPSICPAAASPLPVLRTAMTILAPLHASSRAVTKPSPLLAPVMITVRPANDGRSVAVQLVMSANSSERAGRLLRRDHESADDRLDVVGLRDRLVGQAG